MGFQRYRETGLVLIGLGVALGILPAHLMAQEAQAPSPKPVATADASAAQPPETGWWLPLGLESYEPSAFGYTKNNDDVAFYNIKISVKFPLAPALAEKFLGASNRVYFSFTGYWGFYIGDRHSSPVVGKEYNPQLFVQHFFACRANNPFDEAAAFGAKSTGSAPREDATGEKLPCYIAVGYNHDSNGQSIDTPAAYLDTQRSQGTAAALGAISRGWDYVGLNARYVPFADDSWRLSTYLQLKYFLSDGLLQGEPEELHAWEHPTDGKPRNEVDGIGFLTKYQFHINRSQDCSKTPCVIGDAKFTLRYGTGYHDAFKFSTVRAEAGIQLFQVPIVFWVQKGYMSDLAQYYRNVKGYGVEIEIGAF